jgi:predicted RNA-binding Zn-ribbon protein involved in translation (DUF1610 family)
MNLQAQSQTTHKCPKCGTSNVRRTHRVSRVDQMLSLLNAYPYYCLECTFDTRFHSFGRK